MRPRAHARGGAGGAGGAGRGWWRWWRWWRWRAVEAWAAPKAAPRRHLGMSAATGLPDCTRVRVCPKLFEFAFEFVRVCIRVGRSLSGGPCSCGPAVCDLYCQRCMPHDLAPPVSAAVPAAASVAVPAAASTACAHTPTREVALVALVALEGSGGLGGSPARCRRVGDEMATILRRVGDELARWRRSGASGP